jgi:hypothetical protein
MGRSKYTPVINEGIPSFTPGSVDFDTWWGMQVDRCINGYKAPGGVWIPGNYYFYLNFCKIVGFDEVTNRKKMISPLYRDQDHEYYDAVNDAKVNGHGIIVLKARRKGFSFMNANILLHEWTFYQNAEIGIGAQTHQYVEDFRKKMILSKDALPTQLRHQTLRESESILMSGYKEKVKGSWIERGYKSMVHFRVMDNPEAFRGTSLAYMIFEEAGEFKQLRRAYAANEECFREGAHQFGVPIIGGTSNNLNYENEDFQYMFYNPEEFNLKSIFIPATKVYYGFFNKKTGISDIAGAEQDIHKRRADKQSSKDKTSYYSFLQEMPLVPEDAFVMVGGTPFDLDKINDRIGILLTNKEELGLVQRGNLVWPQDEKGRTKYGGTPIFEPDPHGTFRMLEEKKEGNWKNLYVAGVDPYHVADDLDEKRNDTRDSKGCMYVHKRFVNMNEAGGYPVMEYCDRPYSKEEFYENCLKIALFYECQVLVENNDDGFLKYFINNGFGKYLKERPKASDAPYSQATNRWGINMKGYQKNLLVELLDEYIKNTCDDIYYLDLLEEFAVFGKKNTDRVMAFGMALIHDLDNVQRIVEEESEDEDYGLPVFRQGQQGYIVPVNTTFDNKDYTDRGAPRPIKFNYGL